MGAGSLVVAFKAGVTTGTIDGFIDDGFVGEALAVEGATPFAGTAMVDGLGAVAEDCPTVLVADAFGASLAATTTAPVAVTGVNPGKLLGSVCMGVLTTVNPDGIFEGVPGICASLGAGTNSALSPVTAIGAVETAGTSPVGL